jgi:GT2 family glycosyltransferase
LSVVVVGRNERSWLPSCLSSVLASDVSGLRLTVHYVDNDSSDDSVRFVSDNFPAVNVYTNKSNLGYAGGCNTGMRAALDSGADYVLLLNPDTRSPAQLIQQLTEFMECEPAYGVVGPIQYEYKRETLDLAAYNEWSQFALDNGERHLWYRDWPDHPSPAGHAKGRAPDTLEHAYVIGSSYFVRAEVLRTVGLFDEVFETYFEEAEHCRRVRWAGWRVAILLNVGIQHQCGGGADGPGQRRYRRLRIRRNRYYFLFADVDWPLPKAFRLAGRWLRRDLAGLDMAYPVGRVRAAAETLSALGWLARHLPHVVRRRRQARSLKDAAGWLPGESSRTARPTADR